MCLPAGVSFFAWRCLHAITDIDFCRGRSARAASASAQQAIDYASISGRVTDATGALIPGARVTARQTETNLVGTADTDHEGRFRFSYLRVGRYEVTVSLPGFRNATHRLTLSAGAAFELPVTLELGTLDTSITVSAPVVSGAIETPRDDAATLWQHLTITEPRSLQIGLRLRF